MPRLAAAAVLPWSLFLKIQCTLSVPCGQGGDILAIWHVCIDVIRSHARATLEE